MSNRHPPDKPIEDRQQTQHKLELVARYWGAWCEITAKATRDWCNAQMWLVDAMAGGGSHSSRTDPDGEVPGTAIIAANYALKSQTAHPGHRFSLRAVDADEELAALLHRRLQPLRVRPYGLDALVFPSRFGDVVDQLVEEIRRACPSGHRDRDHLHRSLWLADPYGPSQIPFGDLVKVARLTGAELVVNLDTQGTSQLLAVARSRQGPWREDAAHLTALFGDERWNSLPIVRDESQATAIAQMYADTYKDHMRFRTPHRLQASAGQTRHLVHLTNSAKAAMEFPRHMKIAGEAGSLWAGGSLTHAERSAAAKTLHDRFAGQTLALREMAAMGTYDVGRLRAICSTGQDDRRGQFDSAAGTMEWFVDRLPDPTLGL